MHRCRLRPGRRLRLQRGHGGDRAVYVAPEWWATFGCLAIEIGTGSGDAFAPIPLQTVQFTTFVSPFACQFETRVGALHLDALDPGQTLSFRWTLGRIEPAPVDVVCCGEISRVVRSHLPRAQFHFDDRGSQVTTGSCHRASTFAVHVLAREI